MNTLPEYLVKSGIALAVFYFFYWFFLRRDTHFLLNRVVLLTSLLLSLVMPLMNFHFFETAPIIPTFNISFDTELQAAGNLTPVQPAAGINIWKILAVIYVSGAILVLLRLIYQGIYMQALSRLSKSVKYNDFTLVYMDKDIIPFSYFNKIYIPSSKQNEQGIKSIIDHEMSHLKQYHFIDLFLAEITTIIQWFNPFAWLYERSVKEVHEYLADRAVLDRGYNQGNYQALLVNQAMGGPVFTLTNQFNQSLIKKRIVMMTKMKSPRWAQLKGFLLLPLIAVMLMAYNEPEKAIRVLSNDIAISSPEGIAPQAGETANLVKEGIKQPASESPSAKKTETIKITGKVISFDTNEPLSGIIVIVKGTTSGTITDNAGEYAINVSDHTAELVFSHVGYETQLIAVKWEKTIDVMMRKQVINIDLTAPNYMVADEKPKSHPAKSEGNYVVVEELPSYPGGTDALKKLITDNLKYPEDAKQKGITGKVLVSFIIDKEGNMVNPKISRGVFPSMDEEALRLAGLVKGWKPAMQNGKAISCEVILPVVFNLKK